MNEILKLTGELFGISSEASYKVWLSFTTLIALGIIQYLIIKIITRNITDTSVTYRLSSTTRYIILIIGLLVIGRIWTEGVASIGTYLGLVSAGLVIVLREPVQDIAAFLFILWKHPFRLGDRIEVNGVKGDVVDQGLFKFSLMEIGEWVEADQSTGRVVHVSNHKVFTGNVYNYTGGFKYIWNEVPVHLMFESNWRKAKEILQQIAERHSLDIAVKAEYEVREAAANYYLNYSKLTPTVYTQIKEFAIVLTIRYLTDPKQRRTTMQLIHEDILEMFDLHKDIIWAYPTSRVYRSDIDGVQSRWKEGQYVPPIDKS
jgi:small-conductance mechanosensitive channel